MAEETLKPEAAAAPAEEVVVEKEKEEAAPPPAATEAVVEEKQAEEPKVEEKEAKVTQSASFKDETNIVGELPDAQKKALEELKQLIQEALNKNEFSAPPPPPPAKEKESKPPAEEKKEEDQPAAVETEEKTEEKAPEKVEAEASAPVEIKEEEEKTPPPAETVVQTEVVEKAPVVEDDGAKTVEAIEESVVAVAPPPPAEKPEKTASSSVEPEVVPKDEPKEADVPPPPPEEVSIWGIPLLADERSDVILLKFLRARDFKVKDAFTMLKNTVIWRKEFGVEGLLEEDLGNELEKVVFMHGFDKEGHPVCYNAYGEFQNKELYHNTFGDDEKRSKFLRWRIQFLEKSIRKLDFSPTGINTIVQVNDLKNSPGLTKRELRQATNHALNLLQDNYPEFVAKQVFINVPWWYLAFNLMISPFLTQRTKSKFVFAGPSKSTDILFRQVDSNNFFLCIG
ncbi:Patellin-3 [Hibiscus syriacus]|uniref:Patellin-3 n=1 Tax=Hibiscus syriacus TaxID=106335 RepID=A0A6A3AQA8_HIBSY|nr:Patellin-3 [Hibiscus syriacus]